MSRPRIAVLVASVLVLLAPAPSRAVFHIVDIDEVLTSLSGDPTQQFIEMKMLAPTQNAVTNSVFAAFDATGSYIGDILVVPGNVPNGNTGGRWLVATSALQTAVGITADFTMPAGILPVSGGMVCYGGGGGSVPLAPGSWSRTVFSNYVDCVSYGTYSGPPNQHTSAPTPLTGEGHSLQRLQDTNSSAADFTCADPITPENNAGTSVQVPASTPCPTTTTTTATTTSTTTTTTLPHGSKCTSKEFTAAGKKAGGKAKCHAKATAKGDPSTLSGCLSAADTKFSTAYGKATAANDCLTNADATTVENEVDNFISGLNQTLTNGSTAASKCTSKEFAAAGKKAGGKAKCYAKAAKKNDTSGLSDCLSAANTKFTTAYGKAVLKGNCLTTADANAAEGDVDSFISTLKNSLAPGLP